MPRFVVLCHHLPVESPRSTHWDWMFEVDGVLETWASPPLDALFDVDQNATISVNCQRLADHRLKYLDYSGPVEGDRGSVERMICGTYDFLEQCGSCRRLFARASSGNFEIQFTTATGQIEATMTLRRTN